jgi:RNase adaptor protein for sRNA GlmZ degradation
VCLCVSILLYGAQQDRTTWRYQESRRFSPLPHTDGQRVGGR